MILTFISKEKVKGDIIRLNPDQGCPRWSDLDPDFLDSRIRISFFFFSTVDSRSAPPGGKVLSMAH